MLQLLNVSHMFFTFAGQKNNMAGDWCEIYNSCLKGGNPLIFYQPSSTKRISIMDKMYNP